MFTHEDMLGRIIEEGDIILFTEPGAGRNLPGLRFGEAEGFTKSGPRVFFLDNNFNRIQVEEQVLDTSVPPYYVGADGREFYSKVGTGVFYDCPPVVIKAFNNRFYIVKKI